MSDASKSTEDLVREYLDSVEYEKDTEREYSHAKTRLSNAIIQLGNHLVPKDNKAEETFSMWVRLKTGEKLLTIKVIRPGEYRIEWRK